jgi:integration host factor subunit alpha
MPTSTTKSPLLKSAGAATLTKADLYATIGHEVGLPKTVAAQLVDGLIEELILNLSRGREIKITGFGSFHLRQKSERRGRNPKTGVEAVISARQVATFHGSQLLKKQLHSDS